MAHFVFDKVGHNVPHPNQYQQIHHNTNKNVPPTPPPSTPKAVPPGYIHHPTIEPLQLDPRSLDDKPPRVAFLEKIADCFEYPERWNAIKGDLEVLAQRSKKF